MLQYHLLELSPYCWIAVIVMSLYAHTRQRQQHQQQNQSQSMEDADTIATPVMSNRISPIHPDDLPPILTLSVPQMEPRFSSPHEAPIVMKSLQSYNRLGLDLDQQPGETTTTTTTTQIPTTICLDTFNNHMLGAASATTASQQILFQIAVQMAVQLTPLVKNKIRRAFYQWYAQQQDQLQQQTPPVKLLHWNGHGPGFTTGTTGTTGTDITGTTVIRRRAASPTKAIGVVRGIPNYGQTCFLNSVLQALASLDCMTHYLEHLVHVQQNRLQYLQHHQLHSDNSPHIYAPSAAVTPPLCQTLLDLLHQINGTSTTASSSSSSFSWSTRRRIDPRPILRAVGQHHAQFRARYGAQVNAEQQDSQELLQAVMDLIIVPSQPPLQSQPQLSSTECNDNNNNNNNKSALSLLQPSFMPVDWCGTQSTIRIDDSARHPPCNEPNTISLWAVIQQKRLQQKEKRERQQQRRLLPVPNACSPSTVTNFAVSHHQLQQQWQQPDRQPNTAVSPVAPTPLLQPPEEKKQELEDDFDDDDDDDDDDYHGNMNAVDGDLLDEAQFEAFIPDDASEDELYQESPVVAENDSEQDISDLYYDEWDDDISALSKAMQIMRTTTSSITPSPLSGWCASALLCRTCRRVRPLQNTPFLDVPVVPTAVSQYFVAAATSQRHRLRLGDPPIKPGAKEPPCLLEECLEDFSSIERVHDVECKNCTIQAEIREQENEKEWQEQTLRNLLQSRRSKRSSSVGSSTDGDASARTNVDADNGTKEFQHLHQELCAINSRLEVLRKIDPDGDAPIPAGHGDRDVDNDSTDFVQLKRSDAFKCLLLSRLPAVLSIHVQRRYFNPTTGQESKTMQHVIFPEILDVAPYCAYGGAAVQPEAPFAGTVDPHQAPVLTIAPIPYRLVAVIEHRGGAHSGHYVCFRRDPNSDGWLWISDETVRPCDWTVVRQCQAYMLFYEALG